MTPLAIIPVAGIGEVRAGDEIADAILAATTLEPGDCLVVTQKIVSKAEGRLVPLDPDDLTARHALVESESVRIVRRRGDLIISETRHGFVCANAGIDLSNVESGFAALLPVDSDRSAKHIRDAIRARAAIEVAVVISDTFGRAWRRGLTDVAIGVSGIAAVIDLRETPDALGRVLHVTEVAVADEIADRSHVDLGRSVEGLGVELHEVAGERGRARLVASVGLAALLDAVDLRATLRGAGECGSQRHGHSRHCRNHGASHSLGTARSERRKSANVGAMRYMPT